MKYLITIILFANLFNSCSKSPKCWGEDKNKGLISSSIQIDCFPSELQENYTITNDSSYKRTFTDTSTGLTICNLPPIDFNSYSLLGMRASGQCEIKMIREVTRMDSENKYHYKVIVKSCGFCKKLAYTDNWVIVPKLPDGWTVTFEIDEK